MTGNHEVYLSLGTNIEREHYLRRGLDALQEQFGNLDVSSVYESDAVGFEGDPFFNLVTRFHTRIPLRDVIATVKQIESDNDRVRGEEKFAPRTLDIDILTFDHLTGTHEQLELPRQEILEQGYVLAPFAEIAPDFVLPGTATSLSGLWETSDRKDQVMIVEFYWQGRKLPIFDL
ncbi:MAG: 2-amino-4-hydroxy-6-hydroxymethyldihydropteridine diphosphokinase [Pseudomonadales bacterium]|nr:2-amino-4-hydroxy-6-hydroxymethyldihydropteridine diphosphokinase [Pseudomonadales bacterium]